MNRQFPDFPRLDQPVPTLARLHMQELHRQAAQVHLARVAAAHEKATAPERQRVARRVLQTIWVGIRQAALRLGAATRIRRPVAAPDA